MGVRKCCEILEKCVKELLKSEKDLKWLSNHGENRKEAVENKKDKYAWEYNSIMKDIRWRTFTIELEEIFNFAEATGKKV